MTDIGSRYYNRASSVSFRRTTERWGGLSNMCAGFDLNVNGVAIQSSEVLYQACRFPEHPSLQNEILAQSNPMVAKRIARGNIKYTRIGWDSNRISIMKWVVFVKLCQNWDSFFYLLDLTEDRSIIEHSEKDGFWGCKIQGDSFCGVNALGRILMFTRDAARIKGRDAFSVIHPLKIPKFDLLGEPILPVSAEHKKSNFIPLPL
ncbi:NADAR family protein [Escherichia coli]|nr:NADAR family protein [Escherichia coli]EFJ1100455.1 NADAR family protein [Escherichia coli]EFJ2912167.1 NADAR family protein [Escherichia coli]EFJ2946618.1 NADAR family protein [Escherichia coli]EGB0862222.1 NADAR family protein [Escherichia coli]EGB0936971.1 NADAR family protein [Escherichia coli]